MKLNELFAKLEKSSEFKKFKKENPNAYFCAAFFVFDYIDNENKVQLDYWIDEGDIETFMISDKILQQKARMVENEKLKEIKKDEIKLDLQEVLGIIKKEAEKQKFISTKLIVILQRLKESDQLIWNITGFSGFNLLRMHIAMDKTFLLNERKSMLEMMKIERGNKPKEPVSEKKETQEKPESDTKDSANYVG